MSAKKAAKKKSAKKAARKKTAVKKSAPARKTAAKAAKKRATKKKKAPPTKSTAAASPLTGRRFDGMTLCFAGRPGQYGEERKNYEQWARDDGAKVASNLSASTDMLIVLDKGATASAKKKAAALNAKSAAIHELSESDFTEMFQPTPDEAVELLKQGKKGSARLQELVKRSRLIHYQGRQSIDLRGVDLRGCDLSDLSLTWAALDGADLRGVTIDATEFADAKNLRLEKAKGPHFRFDTMSDCVCKGAELPHAFAGWHSYGRQKNVQNCDFTGTNLDDSYFNYATIESTSFKNANLSNADVASSKLVDVDATQADFTNAKLSSTTCSGCVFAKAKFVGTKLQDVDFGNSDLSGADFSRAILVGANLSAATLDRADFTGAVIAGANFDGADTSKAKGLKAAAARKASAGKACRQLATAAKKADEISADVVVTVPEGTVKATVYSAYQSTLRFSLTLSDTSITDESIDYWTRLSSFQKTLERLGELFGHGEIDFGQLKVSSKKSDLKGKALKELVTSALCEVFDIAPPSEEDVKSQQQKVKQAKVDLKQELAAELRGGKTGITKFNKRKTERYDSTELDVRKEDFSGANMTGIKSSYVNFQGGNLEKARIRKGKLESCNFRDCNLKSIDVTGSSLTWSRFTNSDLSGATLTKSNLAYSNLDRANLTGADATGVNFTDGSVLGTNLSDTVLKNTKWRDCVFDDQTVFPDGFTIPEDMEYKGKGHDPRHVVDTAALSQVIDFDTFMDRLRGTVDQSRLKKSLKMLKADRFELFSEVDNDSFVGVVKSQTDPDLVYSARLTSGGDFACCTQNLNPCGGLRGALCKHLLVLIVGLTKSGQLDANTAATWADASNACKPNLDKDVMSEALLKYKGAEAGEVDWRPVETIPEDYYAF